MWLQHRRHLVTVVVEVTLRLELKQGFSLPFVNNLPFSSTLETSTKTRTFISLSTPSYFSSVLSHVRWSFCVLLKLLLLLLVLCIDTQHSLAHVQTEKNIRFSLSLRYSLT